MGVHNLWRLLELYAHNTTPEEWAGSCVAVDASVWIQQFRSALSGRMSRFGRQQRDGVGSRQGPTNENDEDGTAQRLLEGFLNRTLKLLYYGITPVYVFDGPSSQLKAREVQRRRESRRLLEQRNVARQARRILRAQVSLGLVPSTALEGLPPIRIVAPSVSSSEPSGHHRRLSPKKAAVALSPGRRFRVKRAMQRRRSGGASVILIAPEGVSRQQTNDFLSKSKSFLAEKTQGDATNAANLLLMRSRSAVSSGSSSMYLGPRSVLERSSSDVAASSANLCDEENCCFEQDFHNSAASSLSPSAHVEEGDGAERGDSCAPMTPAYESTESWFLTQALEHQDKMTTIAPETPPASSRSSAAMISASVATSRSRMSSRSTLQLTSPGDSDSEKSDDSVEFIGSSALPPPSPPPQLHADGVKEVLGPAVLFDTVYWKHDGATTVPSAPCIHPAVVRPLAEVLDESSNSVIACSVPPSPQTAAVPTTTAGSTARSNRGGAPIPRLTRQHRQVDAVPLELLQLVDLLHTLHVPYVVSPGEADAQCAYLCQNGVVDAVFTEDSDVVVHGASVVLRGFFTKPVMTAVRQRELADQGITKDVLLGLTELLGCDYSDGMHMPVADALVVMGSCLRCPTLPSGMPVVADDGDATALHNALEALRRWKVVAMSSAIRSSHAPTGKQGALPPHDDTVMRIEEELSRVLDEDMTILQRSVTLAHHERGRWDLWGEALLAEASHASANATTFPHANVLSMFTEHVPVDMHRLSSRPLFPEVDWDALRRFMRSHNLDHMWERVHTTQRAVQRLRDEEAQRMVEQSAARHGHRDISTFLSKPLKRAPQQQLHRGTGEHAALHHTDVSGIAGVRGSGRIIEAVSALGALRPAPVPSSL